LNRRCRAGLNSHGQEPGRSSLWLSRYLSFKQMFDSAFVLGGVACQTIWRRFVPVAF
jgi:hypothetical protein